MPPEAELILEWLGKADDDLRLAEMAMNARPPVYWGAAFHAQQAVGKLLKALLTHNGIEFERVHNIDYLLDLCIPVEPKAEELRPTATKLTDFAVEPRYPVPRRMPTETETSEAIQTAHHVRKFVRERLAIVGKESPGQP